jgi:hypothetical protein
VKDEALIHGIKEERNIIHTEKGGSQTGLVIAFIGTPFSNVLQRIEVTGRRRKRCKQLLDLKEMQRY